MGESGQSDRTLSGLIHRIWRGHWPRWIVHHPDDPMCAICNPEHRP